MTDHLASRGGIALRITGPGLHETLRQFRLPDWPAVGR